VPGRSIRSLRSLERELRGVWVATVSNIDFPRTARLTPEQATAELEAIVARTATAGLNAIFFQVRPEGDALYRSTIEPWSRFLTGRQGGDPGYDPLAVCWPRRTGGASRCTRGSTPTGRRGARRRRPWRPHRRHRPERMSSPTTAPSG
jgi:hypothetical protein